MLEEVEGQAAVSQEDEMLENHEGRDLKLVIDKALSGIPRDWAVLVRMHYMEDLSYAEVSMRTGKPLGSIGPTLTRSLSRLRLALPQLLSA